jgi:uncharacterized RDD family membrane protein YckC
MSDEGVKKADGGHGLAWAMGIIGLVVFYLLSPPPVAWALEKFGIDEPEWFEWFYAPLIIAYDRFEPVARFYNAYGELLGVDM